VTSAGHTRQQHASGLVDEDRLVVRYVRDNWTLAQCQRVFGVGQRRAETILAAHGVTLRDQVKVVDEELILRSYAHHGSIAITALAANATWLTVTAVLDKHGITHAMGTDATRPQIAQPWRPVAGSLRSQIADGTYKPGDLLPCVSDLRATWGVSSPLVTRAFKALNNERLIQLIQGKGWIVRQHSGPAGYSLHSAAGGLLDVTQGNDPVPGTRGWAPHPATTDRDRPRRRGPLREAGVPSPACAGPAATRPERRCPSRNPCSPEPAAPAVAVSPDHTDAFMCGHPVVACSWPL
jgi:hypothetical protein